ncbi:MAG: FKBP-type peptidyl-prolyl cis-trans isomerase [Treponema sp.]|jgi:FKBP-type peptidyl-prolyl cis-trans isomerase|nr:FKBP-type peptidyl-prolyl cis-trans isomerase [Treponema sp.]
MKKKTLFVSAVLFITVIFGDCKNSNSGYFPGEENFSKDASYAMGMNLGARLREGMLSDGIIPNMDEFLKGIKDGFGGRETRFDIDEAIDLIDSAYNTLRMEFDAPIIQAEVEFLAQNAKRPEVMITPSGLQYEILIGSDGPKPSLYDTIKLHYEGRLSDGYCFDSTYEQGRPVDFMVSDVFPGWSEGLQLMTVGSTYKFYIPSELAFGSNGNGPIPPYAALIFTVELLEIL